MSYSKQTWDGTSYVNPTRMNHIEDGIDNALPKDSGGTIRGTVTVDRQDGTNSAVGSSGIILGNDIPSGTAKNSRGYAYIYGTSAYYARLRAGALTANRNIDLPDESGIIALTSDKISTFPVTPVNNSNISRYLVYRTGLSGNIVAGETKDLGAISVPTGYSAIVNIFFAPDANLPLVFTFYGGHIYCYSFTYTGTVNYSVLMLCDK